MSCIAANSRERWSDARRSASIDARACCCRSWAGTQRGSRSSARSTTPTAWSCWQATAIAVIARATQLQAEEGGGEHRYDAKQIEAYMASRPKGTRAVPKQAQRDEIRRYVAELLEQEPRPSRMKMLEAVNAKFGVQLTIGNLDMTYLPGARQVNERKRADMTQQQRGLVVNAKSVAEVDGRSQAPAEGVRAEQRSPVTGNARQGTGEAAPASSPEPNPLDNALRAAADYAVRRNGRADPTHGPVFLTQFVFGGRTRITIDVILPAGSGLRLMAAAALVLAEHPEVLNG